MNKIVFILLFIFNSYAFSAEKFNCTFKHVDIGLLEEVTKIDYKFDIHIGQTKYINFPNASQKMLHVSLYELGDNIVSLAAKVRRNKKSYKAGEISENEAELRIDKNLMVGYAATELLGRYISVGHDGAYYEHNNKFKVSCLRK